MVALTTRWFGFELTAYGVCVGHYCCMVRAAKL